MVSFKSLGKDLTKGWNSISKGVTGTGSDTGVLGLGQYKAGSSSIDESAFTDTDVTDARRSQFANALAQNQATRAPSMSAARVSGGDQAAVRAQQSDFLKTLQARAEGRGGPSAAELQMNRGLDQATSNAMAQAKSARGISPAAALRMSMTTGANAQQDIAAQSSILRAQEQAEAEGQYANQMGNMRTADLDLASRNAELSQNASQANLQSNIQNRQMMLEQDRFLREGQMTMDERDRQAAMDLGKLRVTENSALAGVNSGAYQAASSNRQGFIGGIASGMAAMFSDERVKKNVKKISVKDREKVEGDKKENPFSKAILAREETAPASYLAGKGIGELTESLYNKYGKDPETLGSMTTPQDTPLPKGDPNSFNIKSLTSMAGKGKELFASTSDGKAKKDKKEGDPNSFLDALSAYTYRYKEPEKPMRGEGVQYGIMAQDLEKTPIGKSMVMDTPEGKVVNYAKAGGAMLATAASLNDRMKELENAFMSRKKRGA